MYRVIDKHANSILLFVSVPPPPPRRSLLTLQKNKLGEANDDSDTAQRGVVDYCELTLQVAMLRNLRVMII